MASTSRNPTRLGATAGVFWLMGVAAAALLAMSFAAMEVRSLMIPVKFPRQTGLSTISARRGSDVWPIGSVLVHTCWGQDSTPPVRFWDRLGENAEMALDEG